MTSPRDSDEQGDDEDERNATRTKAPKSRRWCATRTWLEHDASGPGGSGSLIPAGAASCFDESDCPTAARDGTNPLVRRRIPASGTPSPKRPKPEENLPPRFAVLMRAPLGAKDRLRPKEGANEQLHIRSEAADRGGTGGSQGLSEDGGKGGAVRMSAPSRPSTPTASG